MPFNVAMALAVRVSPICLVMPVRAVMLKCAVMRSTAHTAQRTKSLRWRSWRSTCAVGTTWPVNG